MKFILVDPRIRKIVQLNIKPTLEEIYRVLDCRYVEALTFVDGVHTFYCDEEARLEKKNKNNYFHVCFNNANFPIAGRMLIMGPTNDEGGETPCKLMVVEVEAWVDWWGVGFLPAVPMAGERVLRTHFGGKNSYVGK